MGKPIESLPELHFVGMDEKSKNEKINWAEKSAMINERLKNYGLSEKWILSLKNCLNNQLRNGTSLKDFRQKINIPLELLGEMLIVIKNADDSISKDKLTEKVIDDILEADFWQGEVIQQVNIVRSLQKNLSLDKEFVIKWGQAFVRLFPEKTYLANNNDINYDEAENLPTSDSQKPYQMIDWKQVLEIETYLNNQYEQNKSWGNLSWRHNVNTNSRVNLAKKYSFTDLIEYLRIKYPDDGLIKKRSIAIKPLYDACVAGHKICPIDQTLLDINKQRNKYLLSDEKLRANLLNECAEFTGSTAFYMKILSEIISEIKCTNPNCTLNPEIKKIILERFSTFDISSVKRSDLAALKEKSILNNRFVSYNSSCETNNYVPPYSKDQNEDFFNDLMSFSRSEVIDIINENSNGLFSYKLRSNESTYATDLSKSDSGNLNIYITLNGLFSFDSITDLKKKNKLNGELQRILTKDFSVLGKESINDDFDPSYEVSGNRMDSSLIVGRVNESRQLYNEFANCYHKKVIKGEVWVHDDVNGKSYSYLNYHSQTDLVGEYKHSIPFENVLYCYFITYLEKYRFNRIIDENSLPEGCYLSESAFRTNKVSRNSSASNIEEDDDMPF